MSELERMTVSQGQQPLSYEKYLALLESAAAIFDKANKKSKTRNINQANTSTGSTANGGREGIKKINEDIT